MSTGIKCISLTPTGKRSSGKDNQNHKYLYTNAYYIFNHLDTCFEKLFTALGLVAASGFVEAFNISIPPLF